MPKRAVILAGGRGTRLRPYTVTLPKPLVPIGDMPILEIILRQLCRHRFEHVTLAVNHQAELIQAFFGDGSKWNLRIDYSLETTPLSTIGPLKLIPDLPPHFLVMNGDVLTDLDFAAFYDEHVAHDRIYSIAAHRRDQLIDYGVLHVNETNHLLGFQEKPRLPFLVSMGVYTASRRILDLVPEGQAYGFDALVLDLLARGTPPAVVPHSGYWMDIGRPDDYQIASDEFAARRREIGV